MKITDIEVFNLRFEYAPGKGFHYSGGLCTARHDSCFGHTDTEHIGIGSCYTQPALSHLLIEHQFAPLLLGRDPRQTGVLWKLMYGLTRWYGRKGAALSTLGALDVTFWDLKGKSENAPIYQMLGGTRNTCPAYAGALLWQDAAASRAKRSIKSARLRWRQVRP